MTVKDAQSLQQPTKSPLRDARAEQRLPWWHYAVCDPYERVNVWSHGVPGLCFFLLGILVATGWVAGHEAFAFFCMCAATTHSISAVTHLFPRNARLRKLDHVGMLALLIGTPISALWVLAPEANFRPLWGIFATGFVSACLPRVTRTCGFMVCGAALMLLYGSLILNFNLAIQVAMYFTGGACFIRNGGHARPHGLTDHHCLHYCVTMACALHCLLLIAY